MQIEFVYLYGIFSYSIRLQNMLFVFYFKLKYTGIS